MILHGTLTPTHWHRLRRAQYKYQVRLRVREHVFPRPSKVNIVKSETTLGSDNIGFDNFAFLDCASISEF
jgi:hypothetical protein